jgi:hypothetical protein
MLSNHSRLNHAIYDLARLVPSPPHRPVPSLKGLERACAKIGGLFFATVLAYVSSGSCSWPKSLINSIKVKDSKSVSIRIEL